MLALVRSESRPSRTRFLGTVIGSVLPSIAVSLASFAIPSVPMPYCRWWGSGEAIWVTSMPRAVGLPIGTISNVTFQNITAVSQNSVLLSGLAPGNVVQGVTLQNVNITIDHRQSWNYRWAAMSAVWCVVICCPCCPYEAPTHDSQCAGLWREVIRCVFISVCERENLCMALRQVHGCAHVPADSHPDHDYTPTSAVPQRVAALTDGVYVERVEDLVLDNVVVTYAADDAQPYWSFVCFNVTNNSDQRMKFLDTLCVV